MSNRWSYMPRDVRILLAAGLLRMVNRSTPIDTVLWAIEGADSGELKTAAELSTDDAAAKAFATSSFVKLVNDPTGFFEGLRAHADKKN